MPKVLNLLPGTKSIHPIFAKKWDDAELWFKKDNKFNKPCGIVGIKLYTSDLLFGVDKKARLFAEIWRECFNEYIREFCYMADCANLSFTWNLCLDNLEFEWSGFSDTLPLYIAETVKRILMMRDAALEKIFAQSKE